MTILYFAILLKALFYFFKRCFRLIFGVRNQRKAFQILQQFFVFIDTKNHDSPSRLYALHQRDNTATQTPVSRETRASGMLSSMYA